MLWMGASLRSSAVPSRVLEELVLLCSVLLICDTVGLYTSACNMFCTCVEFDVLKTKKTLAGRSL